jgi:hypothetical protein
MKCVVILNLTFTETVSETVLSSITIEGSAVVASVESTLESSIGAAEERTCNAGVNCGSDQFTP